LDVDAMNECAAVLKDYVDFTSFSKLHTDTKTNDCNIYRAIWTAENGHLTFEITANRFLRNMVRSIVGTMVDVGRHKIGLDGFKKIIEARDRNAAGFSAPAHGLILLDIQYADNIKL
jgi:tRNA pseudouridine38-40 synthase